MHVLMVGGLVPCHPAAGGGQIIAYKLAEAIARAGHRVDYVAIAPKQLQRQADWGNLIYTPEETGFLPAVSRILQTIREDGIETYDILHVHASGDTLGYYLGCVIRRAFSPVPRLAMGVYAPQAYKLPRSLNEAGWMCLCRTADVIFALSDFSAHNIARAYHVPLHKMTVMYGGVDESFFVPNRIGQQGTRTLLFCGRLGGRLQGRRQQKGIDILLQAMPTILAHHQVKLEIVGSGPLLEAFQVMACGLGVEEHVEFTGFVEYAQMPDRYASADLFVLPSRRESFGLVLAEAMAARLPVVATQVGAIPEVVKDGETGILVPPEDPLVFAEAVNDLLSHPRKMKDMGAKGRERVERHFTWDKVAERVLESYHQIL